MIQFRARYDLSTSTRLICISENATNKIISETHPESAYLANQFCRFHTFFALCDTVTTPTSIMLTTPESMNTPISVPIVFPPRKKVDLVTCGSPMFFAERWQQAALSIEILYFYGVSKQIYYFMSSSEDMYSLLKAYESLDIISIIPWAVPDIPHINSKKQLYMRDQMAAVNDCYNRYREAADFIMIHDMDDLIFLPNGQKYYDQFNFLYRNNPDAAFLHYASYVTSVRAPKISEEFSVGNVLRSGKVGANKNLGKTIFDPKRTKSVWIHYPHFFPPQMKPYEVPSNYGLILHTRTWNIEGEEVYEPNFFKVRLKSIFLINRLISVLWNKQIFRNNLRSLIRE